MSLTFLETAPSFCLDDFWEHDMEALVVITGAELASHIIQRTYEYNFDNFMYKDDHHLTNQVILNSIVHTASTIKGILS